jgi:hypothetical protein
MTAENKAKELVDWYYNNILSYLSDRMKMQNAKLCAKKCVDEIIKSNPTSPLKSNYIMLQSEIIDEATEYWNEVLTSIDGIVC